MKNIWNKKLIASLFFAIIASMVLSLNCFAQEDNTVYFIKYNNYEPYQMYENGELKGFEVAIAEEIFANSPYDYEFVSKNELDGLAGLSHFGYGKYDIIDDTNHVKSDILYNKVFAPFTLASQNGEKLTYSSLKKLNVGVTETNYCLEVLKGKGIEPTVYKGDFDGIKALLNGEIDVWFSEVNVVNAVSIAQNVKSMLFYHNELVIEGPVSIILPNKNPEMVKFVNNEIANLKSSGKFETIYENYFLKHSSDYIARNKRNRTINGVVTTSAIFIVVFLLSYKKIYKVFSKSKLSINIAKNMLNYGNRFIIIWKSDFTYCEVNNYFKDSFGLEKEVMNGDLNGYFDRIFSQDQVKLSQEDVEKMLAIDSVVTKTKDVRGVDREIKWISIIMINGKKSKTILSIGSDNTEKKTLERELKVTEERYQIAMESTDIAMIYLDRNGAVPYLSDVGY
ncbi:MAG: transporter substrate-binding domain-containing protein, partial [Oscillospiraceae bacterium]